MSSDVAIRVTNLSKCYLIYDRPQDRLKQSIVPRLQRLVRRQPARYFREFWALKDVSFEVKKGETVGIIGRNGAGKSTLLQLICGTLNPTYGSVEVNGRVAALLELGSGFNPEFTGRENVYMNASLLGLSREETDERFEEIVEFADIGDFIDQPIKMYSSGMVLRLAFAVIAHVDADILIVDEALAVGDAFFVQKCMRFLRDFIKKGTLLFVSHDTPAVVNLCTRAILLSHGRIEMEGDPKDVAEYYLEELYREKQETQTANKIQIRESIDEDCDEFYDMRRDLIISSNLRNDIEVFRFDPDSPSFGAGGAKIVSVKLFNLEGKALSWVVGGEMVKVKVTCKILKPISSPIVGFYIKDRLGQTLFGDNTYLTYMNSRINLAPGQNLEAVFEFRMPILPAGDYSICTAIAEGSQEEHVQHHWVHDALIIRSHSSSACTGLIGIPMRNITLEIF